MKKTEHGIAFDYEKRDMPTTLDGVATLMSAISEKNPRGIPINASQALFILRLRNIVEVLPNYVLVGTTGGGMSSHHDYALNPKNQTELVKFIKNLEDNRYTMGIQLLRKDIYEKYNGRKDYA